MKKTKKIVWVRYEYFDANGQKCFDWFQWHALPNE